jgi:N-methylhydantoinase A
VEIVGLHLVAVAEIEKLGFAPLPGFGAAAHAALKGRRAVDYMQDGVHDADIYDAARLEPGMAFQGPAVIEDSGTTVVVLPKQHVRIDGFGNIHMETSR